jgi:hypothetical protein
LQRVYFCPNSLAFRVRAYQHRQRALQSVWTKEVQVSTCSDVKEFDSAYVGVIKAIGRQDLVKIKAEYDRWQKARTKLAARVQDAAKDGELSLVSAIDAFVESSFESLDGSGETLLTLYPRYVEARGAVRALACNDLVSWLAAASKLEIGVAIPGIRVGIDIKKLLEGVKKG